MKPWPFLLSLLLVGSVSGFFAVAAILLNHYDIVSSDILSVAVIAVCLTGLIFGWKKGVLYLCVMLSVVGGIEAALYSIRHPDPLEKFFPGVSGSLMLSALAIAIALILGVAGFRKRPEAKTS